jgi:hypothetical protein
MAEVAKQPSNMRVLNELRQTLAWLITGNSRILRDSMRIADRPQQHVVPTQHQDAADGSKISAGEQGPTARR